MTPGVGITVLRETGPFLLNDGGSTANPVMLQFTLDSTVQPGDSVVANVEAVVEVTDSLQIFPTGVLLPSSRTAFAQWDFPRTTEANLDNDPGTVAQ